MKRDMGALENPYHFITPCRALTIDLCLFPKRPCAIDTILLIHSVHSLCGTRYISQPLPEKKEISPFRPADGGIHNTENNNVETIHSVR